MALVIGDVAGHDVEAAVRMGVLRNLLRALAVDRMEPPGDLLRRLDRVAGHLQATDTATCVYALLDSQPRAVAAAVRHADPRRRCCHRRGNDATSTPPSHADRLELDLARAAVVDYRGSRCCVHRRLVEHRTRNIQGRMRRLEELAATLAPALSRSARVIGQCRHPGDDVCLSRCPTTRAD